MTKILVEQMRSISRRLNEIDSSPMAAVMSGDKEASNHDVMPTDKLTGTMNTRRLADLLGIKDFNNFNQAIMKAKQGRADKLNRSQATELAIAFEMLLRLDSRDTQKAMNMLKQIHADNENSEEM